MPVRTYEDEEPWASVNRETHERRRCRRRRRAYISTARELAARITPAGPPPPPSPPTCWGGAPRRHGWCCRRVAGRWRTRCAVWPASRPRRPVDRSQPTKTHTHTDRDSVFSGGCVCVCVCISELGGKFTPRSPRSHRAKDTSKDYGLTLEFRRGCRCRCAKCRKMSEFQRWLIDFPAQKCTVDFYKACCAGVLPTVVTRSARSDEKSSGKDI